MSKIIKNTSVKNDQLVLEFTPQFLSQIFSSSNSDVENAHDLFMKVKDSLLQNQSLKDKYSNDLPVINTAQNQYKPDISEGVECLKRMKLAQSSVDGKFSIALDPEVSYHYTNNSWQSSSNEGSDFDTLLNDLNDKHWKYGQSYLTKLKQEILKNHSIYAY